MLMSHSKNQKAAKEFLRLMHTPANYEKWFMSQKGFATPPTAKCESHKLWGEDPVMEPYKVAGRLGQAPGYAGPAGKKAAEVLTKNIIVYMYAKAIQGMPEYPSKACVPAAVHGQRTALGARHHPGAMADASVPSPRTLATLAGLHVLSSAGLWPSLGFWVPIAPASAAAR